MFAMLNQLWSMLTMCILGLEGFAKAFCSLGNVANETAKAYEEEARVKREAALTALNKEHNTSVTKSE